MGQVIEELKQADMEQLAKKREWLVGHCDNPKAYTTVSAKLKLIQMKHNHARQHAHFVL